MVTSHFMKISGRMVHRARSGVIDDLESWKHAGPLIERRARKKAAQQVEETIERLRTTPADEQTFISLDLSGLHISDINWGKAVYEQLGNLLNLFIDNTHITSLPDDLRLCNNLKLLVCNHSSLESLPVWLSECRPLQALKASHTRLQAIPAEIFSLPYLHTLKLDNNQLTQLPENVKYSAMLKEIDLTHNQLSTLPEYIKALGPDIVQVEGNTASVSHLFSD